MDDIGSTSGHLCPSQLLADYGVDPLERRRDRPHLARRRPRGAEARRRRRDRRQLHELGQRRPRQGRQRPARHVPRHRPLRRPAQRPPRRRRPCRSRRSSRRSGPRWSTARPRSIEAILSVGGENEKFRGMDLVAIEDKAYDPVRGDVRHDRPSRSSPSSSANEPAGRESRDEPRARPRRGRAGAAGAARRPPRRNWRSATSPSPMARPPPIFTGVASQRRSRRAGGADRRQRRRQVDAPQMLPRLRPAGRRRGRAVRRAASRASRAGSAQLRGGIGFVAQKHNLVPRLSVLSNVIHGTLAEASGPRRWLHGLAPRPVRERAPMRRSTWSALPTSRSAAPMRCPAASRSGSRSPGRSSSEPRLMLADEPAASLDPAAGEEVMAVFARVSRETGTTLVFTTHHLDHALRYAERVIGLAGGRLAARRAGGGARARSRSVASTAEPRDAATAAALRAAVARSPSSPMRSASRWWSGRRNGAEWSFGELATGLPALADFLSRAWPPSLDRFGSLSRALVETFQMAIIGTLVGVILSLPLAILGARGLTGLRFLELAGAGAGGAVPHRARPRLGADLRHRRRPRPVRRHARARHRHRGLLRPLLRRGDGGRRQGPGRLAPRPGRAAHRHHLLRDDSRRPSGLRHHLALRAREVDALVGDPRPGRRRRHRPRAQGRDGPLRLSSAPPPSS